jgi:hypothetical protein
MNPTISSMRIKTVVDQTGLTARYDFKSELDTTNRSSKPTKAPADVFVIDPVAKPSTS